MKKITTFLFAFFLFFCNNCFAQGIFQGQEGAFASQLLRGDLPQPTMFSKDISVNNSPFFNNEYCDGELWLTKNRHYTTGYQYKFDESKNVILFKNLTDNKEMELTSAEVLGLQINHKGKTSLFFKGEIPNESKSGTRIFQMLFNGKSIKFYKLPIKKLYELTRETNTGTEKYAEYKSLSRYFIQFGELPSVELNLTKKSLMQTMSAKYSAEAQKRFDSGDYKGILTEEKIVKLLQELEAQK